MDRPLPPPSMPKFTPWQQQAQHQHNTNNQNLPPPPPPPPRNSFQQTTEKGSSMAQHQFQYGQKTNSIPPPPPPPPIQQNLLNMQHPNQMPQTLPPPPPPPPPPKKQHISAPPMFHRPPPHMTTTPGAQVTTHPQLMLPNQAMLTPISQSSAVLQVPGQPFTGTVLNNAVPLHQVAPMVIPPPTFIPGRPNIIPGVLNTFPSNLPIHQKVLLQTTQHRQHVSQAHKALSDTNRAKINAKSVVDASWTEHTAPSGLKYYYNSITKESTYIRPQCFQSPHQPQQSQQQQQQKQQQKKEEATANQKWIEYDDPATGKKYYSNSITTTWEKPTNFQPAAKAPTVTKTNTNKELVNKNIKKPHKNKQADSTQQKNVVTYSNKEEAITAFKGLLLAKDITPTMKFMEVQKICSNDVRWDACKTLGERKQALAEYQTKLQKETKELKREELKRAKDAFYKLLIDHISNITPYSKYKDLRDLLKKDDRFFAIEKEGMREELFYDFCEEMRKREDRIKRLKKKNAIEGFKSFLSDCYEDRGILALSSTWSSFQSSLLPSDYNDSRYMSKDISDEDKHLIFSDYIIELQEIAEEKRRRIMEARHRAEKIQRDDYRSFLRSLVKEGGIRINSIWREVQDTIVRDQSYNFVYDQDIDAPRIIYEDLLDDLRSMYRKDKSVLSRIISNHCQQRNKPLDCSNMSFEQFSKLLLSAAASTSSSDILSNDVRKILAEEPISSALIYYIDLTFNRSGINNKKNLNKKSLKRSHDNDSSSEDEGEIVEDGEVREDEDGEEHFSKSVSDGNGRCDNGKKRGLHDRDEKEIEEIVAKRSR